MNGAVGKVETIETVEAKQRTDWSAVQLLSGDAIASYTPEAFKAHVVSLKLVKQAGAARSRIIGAAKRSREFQWRRNAKGTLCITVRRRPKFLFRSEVDTIARESGESLRETWLKVTHKRSGIAVLPDQSNVSASAGAGGKK